MATWIGRYRVPEFPFPDGEMKTVCVGGNNYDVTYVTRPVPYVIVASGTSVEPGGAYEAELELVRRKFCAEVGCERSASIPKLSLVGPSVGEGALSFRSRLADGGQWHPRAAGTGLLSLGVALTAAGSTPSRIGGALVDVKVIDTPAGARQIGLVRDSEGWPFITLPITVLPLDPIGERP